MVEIKHCSTDSDFSSAIQITKDYIRWLNMDLSFQDIDKELSNFPSMYGPSERSVSSRMAQGQTCRWRRSKNA